MDPFEKFRSVPGRLLLDTCILNRLYDDGTYIFEGEIPDDAEGEIDPDLEALRNIFLVNQRARFQLLVSPLVIAEIANIQAFSLRERYLRWVLDVLDHWLVMLDEIGDRYSSGGTVRHRFKLSPELQDFEISLMTISDFKRDPFDRLLLVQYKMGNCDAFLTTDRDTIWRHREHLEKLGVRVLTPSEYWKILEPWSALWL